MESQEVRSDPEGLKELDELERLDEMDELEGFKGLERLERLNEMDELEGFEGFEGWDGIEGTAFNNDSKMICCSETRDVLSRDNTHRRTNSCTKSSRTRRSRFSRECSRGFNRCTVF